VSARAQSLDGVVRDSLTRTPLAKASVVLTAVPGHGEYAERTDGSGKFHFEAIDAGSYDLEVERRGYADAPKIRLQIHAGETVRNFAVEVAPLGIIAGKVVDPDGEPVPGARVSLLAPQWRYGQSAMDEVTDDDADERGEFRFVTPRPGRYSVAASPGWQPGFWQTGVRDGPGKPEWRWGRAASGEMEVRAGQEISGLELKLPKTPCFRLRGTADLSLRGRWPPLSVQAVRVDGGGAAGSMVEADGRFEIHGVTPGEYLLSLREAEPLTAGVRVAVTSHDVEGIALHAAKASLAVHVRVDGETAIPMRSLRLHLEWLEPNVMQNRDTSPDGGGSAVFADLAPGRYALELRPRADAYVESLSRAGQPVASGEFELTAGSSEMELVVTKGTDTVAGVADKPTPGLTAVLMPLERKAGHPPVFSAAADQNGAFSLEFVPPGQYRAFLVAQFDEGLWWNGEFRKQVEALGTAVEVPRKGGAPVQVVVIDENAMQQAIARVGQ
jgi:hypothetical protein